MDRASGITRRKCTATDHRLSSSSTPGNAEIRASAGETALRAFSILRSASSPGIILWPPGSRHSRPHPPPRKRFGTETREARSSRERLDSTATKFQESAVSSLRSERHAGCNRAAFRSGTRRERVPSKSKTHRLRYPPSRFISSRPAIILKFYALAHSGGIQQHAPGPAVDVEFAYEAPHDPHPVALLSHRHGQGHVQRGGALVDVVGVDDQRLGQLAGRARELAQYQHPPLVIPGGRELLRHQVHAVVQAAYVAHVRRAEVFVDVGRLVVLHFQQDGRRAPSCEAVVDPAGQLPYTGLELPVFPYGRAAGGRDLNEAEFAYPARLHLQKALDRK